MKKFILIFALIICIFNLFGYSQVKILRDRNSYKFYNFILDSIVKMDQNTISIKNKKRINISRYTIENNLKKIKDHSYDNSTTCFNTLYNVLKSDKIIDSNEIVNLTNTKKKLIEKYFDLSKYNLVESNDLISFSEPLYFSNNKYAIVACTVNRGGDGFYLFKKNKNAWIYFRAFCEVTY
jgi:hypothetical protein